MTEKEEQLEALIEKLAMESERMGLLINVIIDFSWNLNNPKAHTRRTNRKYWKNIYIYKFGKRV